MLLHQLTNNDGALITSVFNNHARRAGDGFAYNVDAELLVEIGCLHILESVGRSLEEASATTWKDTLLNGSARRIQSINNAVLLFSDLDLRGTTDLDDSHTARELSQTLAQLLLLVLRGRWVGHDATDLFSSLSNCVLATLTVEDDSVLLGDGDGTGGTEHVRRRLLKLDVQFVREHGAVGQNGNIAKDTLPVVTEARSLDSSDLQLSTQLVKDADCESLTIDILGNDDKRAAELLGGFKGRNDILNSRDLLLRQEQEWFLELDFLGLGVGDEVWRDETAIELHTLSDLELIFNGLAFLDGDDTLLANLFHCTRQQLSDVLVTIG
ncbi:hypothetical protein, variant [Verruconis gallopava]|uniref:Uncharacterized protein n=1 Tax=Verruconis gallopava TaxID=253628 RepID=A0A0D2ASY4_9PEZI|nr:uncharacterized protein PV09_00464 [Verruconis gallopava]XP_016219464.1 hypothetical protein, variant [Verruconis gallopava]KIW09594.1 hypothetical protein PV09_00464 [Verruconis gallopava]KIW09595.1 hypothetical protein, variant [Verruconis gallopava]